MVRRDRDFARLSHRLLQGAALVALLSSPAVGWARQAAPADTSATAIEEIVVTAQKRSENVQDVPIAIAALGQQQLQAAGVTDTSDLKAAVPALNFTVAAGGYGLPRIRGVGATGQGPGMENPVAVYIDGVYYGASTGVLQNLYDVDQIAVLKGPQGTLFGRNATGGLIQVSTLAPSHTPRVKAEVGYGNYGSVSTGAFVTGGLSDTLSASLSGQYEKRSDGYGKNLFTGHDVQDGRTWMGRAKLLWEPRDTTSVLLSGDFNGKMTSEPAFRNFALNTLGQNVTQQIIALGGDPDRDIYADVDPYLKVRQIGTGMTVNHDFGGANLKSITAYRKTNLHSVFDPDGTTQARTIIDNTQYDKQFTQEINLVSKDEGALRWVLGGFYMKGSAGTNPGRTTGLFVFGGNGYTLNINQVKLDSKAAFAEATYRFGENTNLTTGIRYTSDDRELMAYGVSYNGNIKTTTTSAVTNAEKTFNKLTWRVTLDHRFSEDLLTYASYNRGFRSGTYIPQATPIVLLEPDVVDAFEVGLKSDLFERRVRFNAAAYYYDEKNIQLMQVISGVQNVYNAEGAKLYGLDADIQWRVTSNVRLFGGINLLHGRYKGFTNAIISTPYPLPAGFVIPTGQTCLGTNGSPFAQLGGNCLLRGDATGNKLQNTPAFTLSAGGSWDIPTAVGKFTLAGNYYYNDGYVGTPDERVVQPHYNTVDASVTWRHPDDHVYVRLWGKNLTDAFYRTQIGASNSGDNGTNAAPRTYGVTLGMDF